MDLTDIYRVYHPAAAQHTFFSAAHRTFPKIDQILGHKASLCKYRKFEIILCILSKYRGIKLELTVEKNFRKYSSTWRMNNTFLNDQ
jgi:hypothetical protein